MTARRMVCATTGWCILAATWMSVAVADEKPVVEEILDILRANRQISEEQYQVLRRKAAHEEQRRQSTEKELRQRLAEEEERRKAAEDELQTVAAAAKSSPNNDLEPESPDAFRVVWKDALCLETTDGMFKLKIGGRIQSDWGVVAADRRVARSLDVARTETGTEFRRARLYISGTIYDTLGFKAQYDFADGEPEFQDVYLSISGVPFVETVLTGHFKEPFSLEELTSSNNMTFMERGLPNAFSPSRNTGIAMYHLYLDERIYWGVGGFRDTDSFGDGFGGDADYNISNRVSGVPWYENDGRQLVHLGFSYTHQFRDRTVDFSQDPESNLAPDYVNTDDFTADGVDVINPEFATVWGPLSVQAEYMRAFVDSSSTGNPQFDGVYAYASYFLTGENRRYRKSRGAFGPIKPARNFRFGAEEGWGAWEIAARYSRLDLDSADVSGGTLNDVTAGVNWYLNPNVRVMFNYVFADLESVGDSNIAQGRFQIVF